MEGCFTCRSRKVKCDGRPGICARCEKLKIECKKGNPPHQRPSVRSGDDQPMGYVTQAGHKRLRTSKACQTCRNRKLKCDAGQPSCSTCLRHKSNCVYDMSTKGVKKQMGFGLSKSAQTDQQFDQLDQGQAQDDKDSEHRDTNNETEKVSESVSRLPLTLISGQNPNSGDSGMEWLPLPSGQNLAPYLDSYLTSVHPICFQNILHPGVLSAGLEEAPKLLLLAICGASAKFLSGANEKDNGRRWIAEAKYMIFRDLDTVSTLSIVVLQTIALHDVHEANLVSAWNLAGISIRMGRQLKLNCQSPDSADSATFLEQECNRRLMWSVFVGDILLASDQIQISEEYVADISLPCNLWNFTQGTPCTTLRLHDDTKNAAIHYATNPNGYLVRVLALKRRIHSFIENYLGSNKELPWLESSQFNSLVKQLENFRRCLPPNMKFEERHMYTFRTSNHLDMFLMIHVWYHACGCELFGAWVPGWPKTTARNISSIGLLPPAFTHTCAERCLSHARQISCLIEKMIKVEPDHLFRDPWLCLSIWDSTSIQVAAYAGEGDATELSHYLKLNLRALANTRASFVLADKTYLECCRVLQNAGLGECVAEESEDSLKLPTPGLLENSTIEVLRRYPFLHSPTRNDFKNWTNLYNATNFTGPLSRESTPGEQASTQGNSIFDGEFQSQATMSDMSFLDDEHMQQFLPWQSSDFQWNDPTVPATAKVANGIQISSVESTIGTDQNLLESLSNSFSPMTRWHALNDFNTGYREPQ